MDAYCAGNCSSWRRIKLLDLPGSKYISIRAINSESLCSGPVRDGQVLVRRHTGEDINPACISPTVKHSGGKIMVWASISAHRPGLVRLVKGNMEQCQYRTIFEETATWCTVHVWQPAVVVSIRQRSQADCQVRQTMIRPAGIRDSGLASPVDPIEHLWNGVDVAMKKC